MNDGEFHARHKPAVQAKAAAMPAERIAVEAARAARELFGAVDANAFLSRLPVLCMARMLGVEEGRLADTVMWVEQFVQGIGAGATAQTIEQASLAAVQLMADGERAGLDRIGSANHIAFMQQSLDATAGLVGNTVCLLQSPPDLPVPATLDAWRAFVSEVARWDPSVQNTRRFAAHDTTLTDQRIAAGEGVLVLLASANRDPALNPDPDRFDTTRNDRRMFTFGAGTHRCPGESIAVEIAAAALHALQASNDVRTMFGPRTGFRPLPNARIPVFGR